MGICSDMRKVLAFACFYIYKCQFLNPDHNHKRCKPTLKMLAYIIPYSENPKAKVRSYTVFRLGAFTQSNVNFVGHFCINPFFGLMSWVKLYLKLLALVIPYSGKPKVR